jgi:hypothetical protein
MDAETFWPLAVKFKEVVEYDFEKIFSTSYSFRRAHEALKWALNRSHKKYMYSSSLMSADLFSFAYLI